MGFTRASPELLSLLTHLLDIDDSPPRPEVFNTLQAPVPCAPTQHLASSTTRPIRRIHDSLPSALPLVFNTPRLSLSLSYPLSLTQHKPSLNPPLPSPPVRPQGPNIMPAHSRPKFASGPHITPYMRRRRSIIGYYVGEHPIDSLPTLTHSLTLTHPFSHSDVSKGC